MPLCFIIIQFTVSAVSQFASFPVQHRGTRAQIYGRQQAPLIKNSERAQNINSATNDWVSLKGQLGIEMVGLNFLLGK